MVLTPAKAPEPAWCSGGWHAPPRHSPPDTKVTRFGPEARKIPSSKPPNRDNQGCRSTGFHAESPEQLDPACQPIVSRGDSTGVGAWFSDSIRGDVRGADRLLLCDCRGSLVQQ